MIFKIDGNVQLCIEIFIFILETGISLSRATSLGGIIVQCQISS